MSKKKSSPNRGKKPKRAVAGAADKLGLLGVLIELLNVLLAEQGPADGLISRFFKSKPFLGVKDRSILSEAAFCWLRFRLRINHLAEGGAGSAVARQAKMALLWSGAPEAVWSRGNTQDNEWLSQVVNIDPNTLPIEARTCMPNWLINQLSDQFGAETALMFAASVLEAAPLDLRVNALKSSRDQVQTELADLEVECEPIEGLVQGLRVAGKPALGKTDPFLEGHFEVQDAASQWVSGLVAPRRGDLVIDFCAGAGGKTLAIAALMKNTGRLVAIDTHERRLQRFKPRAARAGLSNASTLLIQDEADPRLSKYRNKADRVLVDSPCSGLGTLRRNPELKFKHSEPSIAEMVLKQKEILKSASSLVRPDGRLIYATCSVLKQENEAVIEEFLVENPDFRLRRWTEVLRPEDRPPGADQTLDCLRLWPHQTLSDGFYAAVLQKSKL